MDPRPTDPPDEVPAEVLDHAIHRLNDGATRQEVIAELVEMGVTESAAEDVVRKVEEVHGPAEPERQHPLNTIFKILGALIVLIGVFLWIGNVVRFFPTFPLAGFLTVALGVALLSIRVRRSQSA
jgi:hypothetical protein